MKSFKELAKADTIYLANTEVTEITIQNIEIQEDPITNFWVAIINKENENDSGMQIHSLTVGSELTSIGKLRRSNLLAFTNKELAILATQIYQYGLDAGKCQLQNNIKHLLNL